MSMSSRFMQSNAGQEGMNILLAFCFLYVFACGDPPFALLEDAHMRVISENSAQHMELVEV